MDRRTFLRSAAIGSSAVLLAPGAAAVAGAAVPGEGPYGPLQPADGNGIMLPKGFSSRVVARSLQPVGSTGYVWHGAPDGGATFATDDGGWVYVSNSEVPLGEGGASALRFGPDGSIADAYRILSGTSFNCAGGATPWGTWLSCEEVDAGRVWECDPLGEKPATVRPALGVFEHEAVAVDPVRRQLYLTEDKRDGRFYRFTPTAYPALDSGRLEVLAAASDNGPVTWLRVPDPSAEAGSTRTQVPQSKAFRGGEGIWYDAGVVYFTTKGDNRVWAYDAVTERISVLYDAAAVKDAPLTGVDNLLVSPSGDIFVAEDGGDLDIVLITPDRVVARFLKVSGQNEETTELAGPAFDPSGQRFYFSSQRGGVGTLPGPGITYEITGPFRTTRPSQPTGRPPSGASGDTRSRARPPAPFVAPRSDERTLARDVLAATGGPAAVPLGLGLVAAALALRGRRGALED